MINPLLPFILARAAGEDESEASTNAVPIKKTKEFRVLDPRAGQNFGSISSSNF